MNYTQAIRQCLQLINYLKNVIYDLYSSHTRLNCNYFKRLIYSQLATAWRVVLNSKLWLARAVLRKALNYVQRNNYLYLERSFFSQPQRRRNFRMFMSLSSLRNSQLSKSSDISLPKWYECTFLDEIVKYLLVEYCHKWFSGRGLTV